MNIFLLPLDGEVELGIKASSGREWAELVLDVGFMMDDAFLAFSKHDATGAELQ
jgi:hypothetical protein